MSRKQAGKVARGGKLATVLLLVILVVSASILVVVPYLKQKEMKQKDAQGLILLDQKSYEEAIALYRGMKDYEPAGERIQAAEAGIREREYQKGETAFEEGRMVEAEDLYLSVHPYQQTAERLDVIKAWKVEYAKRLEPFRISNGKYGYRDPNGTTILPAIYLSAGHFSDGYAPVKVEQKGPERNYTFDDEIFLYIDAAGKEAFDQRFARATEFRNGYAIVGIGEYADSSNAQHGIIDKNGQFALQAEYQEFRWINDSELIVRTKGLYGVINLQGDVLLEPTFHEFEPFYEGMAAVCFDKKWGYVSAGDYRLVVKPQFSSAHSFFEGSAIVRMGAESGLIDAGGNFIIPMQVGSLSALGEKYDKTMEIRHSFFYRESSPIAESALMFVMKLEADPTGRSSNLLYTVYDATGKVIIRSDKEVGSNYGHAPALMGNYICMTTGFGFTYSKSDPLARRLYTMEGKPYANADWIEYMPVNGEDWFLLTAEKAKILLTPDSVLIQIADAKEYRVISDNCIAVNVDGKWGLIDKQGKLLAEYQWDQIDAPSEGIMKAKMQGKWGYLAESGAIISDAIWEDAADFHEGRAVVKQRALYDYIDTTGKQITFDQYDEAFAFSNGLARVSSLGKWGFINSDGKTVIPLAWDKATNFVAGFAYVAKESQQYRIGVDGSQVEVEPDASRFVTKSSAVSSRTTKATTELRTKKCLQCGAPIYADETWCDDCLFGAFK